MIELIFNVAIFAMGAQLAFGKMDESKLKLKPGQSIEDVKKRTKTCGYLFMVIPIISLFILFYIL